MNRFCGLVQGIRNEQRNLNIQIGGLAARLMQLEQEVAAWGQDAPEEEGLRNTEQFRLEGGDTLRLTDGAQDRDPHTEWYDAQEPPPVPGFGVRNLEQASGLPLGELRNQSAIPPLQQPPAVRPDQAWSLPQPTAGPRAASGLSWSSPPGVEP